MEEPSEPGGGWHEMKSHHERDRQGADRIGPHMRAPVVRDVDCTSHAMENHEGV